MTKRRSKSTLARWMVGTLATAGLGVVAGACSSGGGGALAPSPLDAGAEAGGDDAAGANDTGTGLTGVDAAGMDATGDTTGSTCSGTLTSCSGACVDTTMDRNHCGSCGKACGPSEVCSQGACSLTCGGGATVCGAACVELAVDPSNCGACGSVCQTGYVCSAGSCGLACTAGLSVCTPQTVTSGGGDAGAVDGGSVTDASGDAATDAAAPAPRCVSLQSNHDNCGTCNTACKTFETCVTGTCRSVPTTWDPTWSVPGSVTYSNGNLSIAGNTPYNKTARTVAGESSGKYYWEIAATGGDAGADDGGIGIAGSDYPNASNYLGYYPSSLGFGYGACCSNQYWLNWPGVTMHGSLPADAGAAISPSNVYMFALDMDAGSLWAGQNGAWYNAGNPATGANPIATGIAGKVYPAVSFYSSSINAFTANFGATAFQYTVPTGFMSGFF